MAITNTATDPDLPANTLNYSLTSAPPGALIDTNGVITWTPSETDGPATNVIDTIVTDNGVPPLSATNSFTVVVTEQNTAPILPAQTNVVIAELTALVITNTATDPDLPANTLSYSLAGAPPGALIDTNGVITWTPSETDGPATNVIETIVTDNGVPPLSATNTFMVIVEEVNQPPIPPAVVNQTLYGGFTLWVTNTASDPDWPANPLTYALVVGPTNAVIDTNGIVSWIPSAFEIPSTQFSPWS